MSDLTLIIPAKKEAESLPSVLDELSNYNFKIMIILTKDDLETINAIKRYNPNIVYQDNTGYGDALIKGINSCNTKYFSIFNADGSFDPKEIELMMYSILQKDYDLIFGSRYQKGAGSEDDTLVTLVGNYIFTYLGKIFFGLNITDILYTFVVGKTKETQDLQLKSKDFSLCVELPIKAQRQGLKILSTTSFERKRIGGEKKVSEFKDGFKILLFMIKSFFKI